MRDAARAFTLTGGMAWRGRRPVKPLVAFDGAWAVFAKLKSAAARAHYRQTLLVSGSLCVLSALASPASAQCASGNGQLTGPGATCNTPQTLTGTNTAGTVATGWTLSTGTSDA